MAQTATATRNLHFDSLKCILIALVVLGHVLDSWQLSPTLLALNNVIYSFHMPLFVFISGYFSLTQADNKKKLHNLLRLAETLIVFQTLYCLQPLLSGEISLSTSIIIPAWSLWYLYSLIAWRALAYFLPHSIARHSTLLIAGAVAISLIAGFIPIASEFSVQRTLTFLPFFVLGYVCRMKDFHITRCQLPRIAALAILIAAFAAMMIVDHNMAHVLWGKSPYGTPQWLYLALRAGFLFAATVMSIAIISIVPVLPTPCLNIGRDTMFIYMYHTLIITAILITLHHLNIPTSPATAIPAYILTATILLILRKSTLLHLILHPITNIINSIKST